MAANLLHEISIEDLATDLRGMSIEKGDTVVVRASLRAIGQTQHNALLMALRSVVGHEGTLIGLSYTPCAYLKKPKIEDAFHRYSEPYTGSFSNSMLREPDSIRSRHPIGSFVAIGKNAQLLLDAHGPDSPCYEPVRRIIEVGGKELAIGCFGKDTGFSSAHLAEYDVGLTRRCIMPWLSSVYYVTDKGEMKLFRAKAKDIGLCSKGYYKYCGLYVKAGILKFGQIGNAYSAVIPLREAYQIEREAIKNNPKFSICDDKNCFVCNTRRWDRVHYLPGYLLRNFRKLYRKQFAQTPEN
jgi:aminoglycoside N3'-acetyltransferase